MSTNNTILNGKLPLVLALAKSTNFKTENIDTTKNSIILVTAAGTIYGSYKHPEDLKDSEKQGDIFLSVLLEHLKDISDSTSPAITLKNATLLSNNGIKQTFDTLFVFIDDIIAVTFGEITNI